MSRLLPGLRVAALALLAAGSARAQDQGPGTGRPPKHEEDPFYEPGSRELPPAPPKPAPTPVSAARSPDSPEKPAPKFVLFASATYALTTWVNTDYLLDEDNRGGGDIDWGANLTGRFLLALLGAERKSPFGLSLEASPGYREWHLRRQDTTAVPIEFHSTDVRMGSFVLRGLLEFGATKPLAFGPFVGLGGAVESYESDFHRGSESPGVDHRHRKAIRGAFLAELGGEFRVRLGALFADARLTIWYTPGTEVVLYGVAISLGVGAAV
ncbi:MAG: hypothetical protein L0216_06845 [Planctomycetales bacterium]|nr:hypothetical protein [Planctomycetales bacterium]